MTDDKAGAPAMADQGKQLEQLKAQLSQEQKAAIDRALGSGIIGAKEAEGIREATFKAMGVQQLPEHIMQFFAHAHLPAQLAAVSKPFADMAEQLVATLPRNPERTVALRKLLESKDAAVRAFIAK